MKGISKGINVKNINYLKWMHPTNIGEHITNDDTLEIDFLENTPPSHEENSLDPPCEEPQTRPPSFIQNFSSLYPEVDWIHQALKGDFVLLITTTPTILFIG
jgi:hypothetical protein